MVSSSWSKFSGLVRNTPQNMPNLNAISWIQFFYEIVGLELEQWRGVAKGGQFLPRAVFIWHIAGFSLLGLSLDHACRWSISIARIFLLNYKDFRQEKHFPSHNTRNVPYRPLSHNNNNNSNNNNNNNNNLMIYNALITCRLHCYYTRYFLVLNYYCEGEGDVLSSGHNIKNIRVHCQWIFAILNFPRIKALKFLLGDFY